MAFQPQQVSKELWSLHDMNDQVQTRDTDGQKEFHRAIRTLSRHPLDVDDALHALAARQGLAVVHANTTRMDTTFAHHRDADDDGIRLYAKASSDGGVLQGVATVAGTVESILDTFSMQSSRRFADTIRMLLPSIACHGATIATDHGSTHVHWLSFVGLSDARRLSDVTFLSSTQLYEEDIETGEPVALAAAAAATDDDDDTVRHVVYGTHVWESVDVPALAAFTPADTQCARQRLTRSGFFVEPVSGSDDDDLCRVSLTLSLAGVEPSNPWVVLAVRTCLRQLMATCRSTQLSLVPRAEWSHESQCHLCRKTFHLFHVLRRRHHCRLCGHSICASCSSFVTLDDPTKGASGAASTVRSCLHCAFADAPKHKPARVRPSRAATMIPDSHVTKPESASLSTPAAPSVGSIASTASLSSSSADSFSHPRRSSMAMLEEIPSPRSPKTDASDTRARRASLQTEFHRRSGESSARAARRAAMLQRSTSFLELAINNPTDSLTKPRTETDPVDWLAELGLTTPVVPVQNDEPDHEPQP
ncbi:Aste57867_11850 [Aphanomyces stellatus]|uniref:Aste57867_11850 protein n=1 Tax=Aphanomyces stellatus TaxID=120398 RepID=A0A485KU55_9STRA|nr:hypothetical protein As57867_011805 [Aphanomyces stellatus]VFT88705.1 Aste57867_11850 [Aphanomyces stellatus]